MTGYSNAVVAHSMIYIALASEKVSTMYITNWLFFTDFMFGFVPFHKLLTENE